MADDTPKTAPLSDTEILLVLRLWKRGFPIPPDIQLQINRRAMLELMPKPKKGN
jgi:hypothetical protein